MINNNFINKYLRQTQDIYGDKLFLKINKVSNDANIVENSLDEFYHSINMCQKCQLGNSRKNFVFGVGDKNADLLLVGEAPGEKEDLEGALETIRHVHELIKYQELLFDANVVKVSVIGVGMRTHAGVASKMFETLADKGINIQVISTSEIKVSVLIAEEYIELALRSLHTAYGLDRE